MSRFSAGQPSGLPIVARLSCFGCGKTFVSTESLRRCKDSLRKHNIRCKVVQLFTAASGASSQHTTCEKARRTAQQDDAPSAARRSPGGVSCDTHQ